MRTSKSEATGMSPSHHLGWGTRHEGIARVMATVDRRSWSLLRGRFLPRARPHIGKGPWKLPEPWTPRTRPPLLGKPEDRCSTATTGSLLLSLVTGTLSPMFPVNSVTYVPGCTYSFCSNQKARRRWRAALRDGDDRERGDAAVADRSDAGAYAARPPCHADRSGYGSPPEQPRRAAVRLMTKRAVANRAIALADGVRHASSFVVVEGSGRCGPHDVGRRRPPLMRTRSVSSPRSVFAWRITNSRPSQAPWRLSHRPPMRRPPATERSCSR